MLGSWSALFWTILFLLAQGHIATLIDLGKMLKLMTEHNPIDFINYGNWCGLGGDGPVTDYIDRCCKIHDMCYGKASQLVCLDQKPHLTAYRWKYAAGKIHCNKRDDPCSLGTCRCDGKFAACVQVHQATYDSSNKRVRAPVITILTDALTR